MCHPLAGTPQRPVSFILSLKQWESFPSKKN